MRQGLLEQAAGRIDDQALLVIDSTDISKPCARKMEHLARVRDGAEGELRDGYWCCTVVAAWRSRADVAPLYQELYSLDASVFVSVLRDAKFYDPSPTWASGIRPILLGLTKEDWSHASAPETGGSRDDRSFGREGAEPLPDCPDAGSERGDGPLPPEAVCRGGV